MTEDEDLKELLIVAKEKAIDLLHVFVRTSKYTDGDPLILANLATLLFTTFSMLDLDLAKVYVFLQTVLRNYENDREKAIHDIKRILEKEEGNQ